MKEHRKWYSLSLISLLKATLYIGLPFFYLFPLMLVPLSMVTGHTVYYNLNPPCLIIYDESMMPEDSAGATRAYIVYIKPDLYNEPMVHHHEYKHVEQYWYSLGFQKFFYLNSSRYRLLYEFEAYVEGLKYSTDLENDLQIAACALSDPHYGLNISPELAYLLLQNGINKHRGIE